MKLELTRLGRLLYAAPEFLSPLAVWLTDALPYRWLVADFQLNTRGSFSVARTIDLSDLAKERETNEKAKREVSDQVREMRLGIVAQAAENVAGVPFTMADIKAKVRGELMPDKSATYYLDRVPLVRFEDVDVETSELDPSRRTFRIEVTQRYFRFR